MGRLSATLTFASLVGSSVAFAQGNDAPTIVWVAPSDDRTPGDVDGYVALASITTVDPSQSAGDTP